MSTIATILKALFYWLKITRFEAKTSNMVVHFTNAATDLL